MTDRQGERADARGFHPQSHFESWAVAKCAMCERLGASSWPAGWVMAHDGIRCAPCFAPDLFAWEDGEIVAKAEAGDV